MPGNKAASDKVVRTVDEPVVSVIHQITAKDASPLPINEKACVTQNLKKVNFH